MEGPAPEELGDLSTAEFEGENRWVTGTGVPAETALSFERAGESGSFRLAQLRSRSDLWLVLPVPELVSDDYVPPHRFTGRLLSVRKAPLAESAVAEMVSQAGGKTPAYLLFHGKSPQSSRDALWASIILGLLGLAAATLAVLQGRRFPVDSSAS